jgi:hypothetical protein
MLALGLEAESDLYRGHAVTVGILIGVLSKLRIDGVFARGNGIFTHLLAELAEVVVDLFHDCIRIFATEKEVKELTMNMLAHISV